MSSKKWIKLFFSIVIVSFILSPVLYFKDMEWKLLNDFDNSIVFFSDSIMKASPSCEKNKEGIDDILRGKNIHKNIININHSAYSPIIYSAFIKNIKKSELIIIPINMRSFSEEWIYNPQYQFYDKRILSEIINLDFHYLQTQLNKIFDTSNKYNSMKILRNSNNIGTIHELQKNTINIDFYCNDKKQKELIKYKKELIKKFEYHYMYDLSINNKMFTYISDIIDYSIKTNIKLLFYITPMNYALGEHLIGDRFKNKLNKNINILVEFLKVNKVDFMDLSHILEHKNFTDTQHVCGHVNHVGRKNIANYLHKYIDNLISKNTI